MNKTKLTYKVARKIYDSYRFLVADFKIKNLKKSIDKDYNTYYTVNHKRTIRIIIFLKKGRHIRR